MKRKTTLIWLALLAAFALVAASCGDDDSDDASTADSGSAADSGDMADDDGGDMSDDDMGDDMGDDMMDMNMTPGEGVMVNIGRATWNTGYFQAELYRALLQELGYSTNDPAELELDPNTAYLAMAQGDMDFWPNSWYPAHATWLASEMPDGSLVGDHVSRIGEEMVAGGLQGYVATKSFVEEFGLATLDDLDANPDAIAAYDATDADPGNGKVDIFGCPEGWTCDNIINAQIAFSGWENIQQVLAGYDAMFAQAVDAANAGTPTIAYTWTPSAYITQARPGDNVVWIGVEDTLDDSNPLGEEGGEDYGQRGPNGEQALAPIPADQCPSAATQADGLCQIGWVAADILVTANNDFLAANPAAEALLEAVKLSVIEVSLANVEQGEGAAPADLAAAWIADNRDRVDEWLHAARSAA